MGQLHSRHPRLHPVSLTLSPSWLLTPEDRTPGDLTQDAHSWDCAQCADGRETPGPYWNRGLTSGDRMGQAVWNNGA